MHIVTNISNIINQHVNMMDEHGMIIASTDSGRIGTFHEAALRIISENLDSLTLPVAQRRPTSHNPSHSPNSQEFIFA